jgi:hypothetical protein
MIALLALLLMAPLMTPQPPEFKVIADLANYLSQGNAPGAMDAFDKNMPGYQTIENNVFAMADQAEISCTIDPIEQNGSVIEVDWFLKLVSKADEGPTERRQQTVKLTIVKVGKKWKITAIDPPSILDPPKI